jgi:hypothetical protein
MIIAKPSFASVRSRPIVDFLSHPWAPESGASPTGAAPTPQPGYYQLVDTLPSTR